MYKEVCKLEDYYNNINKKNTGYSDIIEYIEKIKGARVTDLSNNKNYIKAHIYFNGEIKKLKKFITYLIKNNNFNNIENVTVNKIDNKLKYILKVNFKNP